MALTPELLLCGSGHLLLADHARDLLLLHQAMNPRNPLVSADRCEVLQCLVVLVHHDDRALLLLYSNLLFAQRLNCIDNTVRNDCVQNIYKVHLVREGAFTELREVLLYLRPLPSILATVPDPLRTEFLPVGQVFDPSDFGLI